MALDQALSVPVEGEVHVSEERAAELSEAIIDDAIANRLLSSLLNLQTVLFICSHKSMLCHFSMVVCNWIQNKHHSKA